MTEMRVFNIAEWLQPQRLMQLALRSPLGAVATSRVIDRPTLRAVTDVYMPLSRLWAAAEVADGDVDRFSAAVPLDEDMGPVLRRQVGGALRAFDVAQAQAKDAARAWDAAFFSAHATATDRLLHLEQRRLLRAQRLLLQRLRFALVFMRQRVPAVRFDIPDEDALQAAYGRFLDTPWKAFTPSAPLPEVQRSHSIPSPGGQDYWLRFMTPHARMGDTAWARVHEPLNATRAPTFIFGNGVCVEFDHVKYSMDDITPLCRAGVRVIEIESPWHGRRRARGCYSGEPFLARAPLGPIDLFTAQVQEIAVLIDWARRQGSPRVGVGGASMGALAAQLAGIHSAHWPEEWRPDVLGLITFCDQVHQLALRSALAMRTGLKDKLTTKGWTPERAGKWLHFTDAIDKPVVSPDRIVAVLGTEDEITPFEIAEAQMDRWNVPSENRFVSRRGHFSTPIALARESDPLDRIRRLLLD